MSWTLIQNPKSKIQNCFVALLFTPHHSHLSNYFVRSCQHIRRNPETDLLGCLEIDDQLELRWLLHRQVGGLTSLQDLVDKRSGAPKQRYTIRPIDHQAAFFRKLVDVRDRRQAVLSR